MVSCLAFHTLPISPDLSHQHPCWRSLGLLQILHSLLNSSMPRWHRIQIHQFLCCMHRLVEVSHSLQVHQKSVAWLHMDHMLDSTNLPLQFHLFAIPKILLSHLLQYKQRTQPQQPQMPHWLQSSSSRNRYFVLQNYVLKRIHRNTSVTLELQYYV